MDIISISDGNCSDSNQSKKSGILYHYSYGSKPVTVSSESSLRCPVSLNGSACGRTSSLPYRSASIDCTPPTFIKVKTWFDKCYDMERNTLESRDEKDDSPSSRTPGTANGKLPEPDGEERKSNILIRCNYNKEVKTEGDFGRKWSKGFKLQREQAFVKVKSTASAQTSNSTVILIQSSDKSASKQGSSECSRDTCSMRNIFNIKQEPPGHSNKIEEAVLSIRSTTPSVSAKSDSERISPRRRASEYVRTRQSERKRDRSVPPLTDSIKLNCEIIEVSESSRTTSNFSVTPNHLSEICPEDESRLTAPLSPESRKKNEFYSYLQLVNLSSTSVRDCNIIRNRRSTRVQNQMLSTVRKEFQRQMAKGLITSENLTSYKKAEKSKEDEEMKKLDRNPSVIIEKIPNRSRRNSVASSKSDAKPNTQKANRKIDLDNTKVTTENEVKMHERKNNSSSKSLSQLKIMTEKLPKAFNSSTDDVEELQDTHLGNSIFGGYIHLDMIKRQTDFEESILKFFSEEKMDPRAREQITERRRTKTLGSSSELSKKRSMSKSKESLAKINGESSPKKIILDKENIAEDKSDKENIAGNKPDRNQRPTKKYLRNGALKRKGETSEAKNVKCIKAINERTSEELSNDKINEIIFGVSKSPIHGPRNKKVSLVTKNTPRRSNNGRNKLKKTGKKKLLFKMNTRSLTGMSMYSSTLHNGKILRSRKFLKNSGLLKTAKPKSAHQKNRTSKLKKTAPVGNAPQLNVNESQMVLPSVSSRSVLEDKEFEVRFLKPSSSPGAEGKVEEEASPEKSDLSDTVEFLPILEHLRQSKNLKKLAPEHFKALVETKKFLKSRNEDYLLKSPLDHEPMTTIKKVHLKGSVAADAPENNADLHFDGCDVVSSGDIAEDVVDVVSKEEIIEIVEETPNCMFIKEENVCATVDVPPAEEQNEAEAHGMVVCDSSSPSEQDNLAQPDSNSTDSVNTSFESDTHVITGDIKDGKECVLSTFMEPEMINTDEITSTNCDYIPLSSNIEVKSLHRSLVQSKRKSISGLDSDDYSTHGWETDSPSSHRIKGKKHQSFSINISEANGSVINVCYIDFNLVIAQELVVSFWNQTALGNVLGAQNMWIPKGSVQRLVLDNDCYQKHSQEMMVSLENSAAYIELWTKEHKSFNRERPVADVFAAIYFWRQKINGLDKKVLQLENIKGFAEDVQYIVLRNNRSIIVSWNILEDNEKTTIVHCYNLASDFQSVTNIKELASVNHYISSLHNIEDCDSIVMGSGDHRFTLWNLEYGYIVATIDLLEPRLQPKTLWVKCDRGFLFTLQSFHDEVLRLIAINGISHKWKKLQLYKASNRHTKLKGVCIENGLLAAFYETGVSCWNVQSGECVLDEVLTETVFVPSNKHVLLMSDDEIHVRHGLSYLLTLYDP